MPKIFRKNSLDISLYAPIAEFAIQKVSPMIDRIMPAIPKGFSSLFIPDIPITKPTIETEYPKTGRIQVKILKIPRAKDIFAFSSGLFMTTSPYSLFIARIVSYIAYLVNTNRL